MADNDIRVTFGATATRDRDDVEQVQKELHDKLVDDLGPARTGPVSWRRMPAARGARWLVEQAVADERDGLVRFCRTNPGGWLVIASAPFDINQLPPDQRTAAAAALAGHHKGHTDG